MVNIKEILSSAEFNEAASGLKETAPTKLTNTQIDELYSRVSASLDKIGLKFKDGTDKYKVLTSFEMVLSTEITPDNLEKALNFYDKKISTIVDSGKHSKYVDFFRKISEEFGKSKDMDIPTYTKISKDAGLVPIPENPTETTYGAENRNTTADLYKKAGKERLYESVSALNASNNSIREVIGTIDTKVGDDQFFSLLQSNDKKYPQQVLEASSSPRLGSAANVDNSKSGQLGKPTTPVQSADGTGTTIVAKKNERE